jgi:hypothetical protein
VSDRRRRVCWVKVADGKEGRRPGVVLHDHGETLTVACGTSTVGRDFPGLEVESQTRKGRLFPLRNTTAFYTTQVVTVPERDITLCDGVMPLDWIAAFELLLSGGTLQP